MTPPFAVPAITVEPGGQMTFSGTASDDEGLKDVEITLRNSSTGEGLANDCTWGAGGNRQLPRLAGQHRRVDVQLDLHDAVQPVAGHATPSPCGPPTTSA